MKTTAGVCMKRTLNIGYAISVDRRDLKEIDYLEKLSNNDFEWLSRFCDNYYSARFLNDQKDVIQDQDEKKERNRTKHRRLWDMSNKLFSTGATDQNLSIFKLLPEGKKKAPKKKKSEKSKSKLIPCSKVESVEDFLARGGIIKKTT